MGQGGIRPGESRVIAELPGIWPEGVDAWSLEVRVSSGNHQTYSNHLVWQ